MQLEERDLAYLFDMLECCNDIVAFTTGVTFEQFASDRMRRLATERQLETLGEAANHLSHAGQAALPDIEWARIVGLRNKLAHDYGELLAERVWHIAMDNIRTLQTRLLTLHELAAVRPNTQEGGGPE